MKPRAVSFRSILLKLIHNISEHEIFDNSAALAFYFSLGLGPILVLLLSGLSLFNLDKQVELIQTAYVFMGPQTAAALKMVLNSLNQRPDLGSLSGWVALGLLLFSASLTFAKIQTTLNKIFLLPPHSLLPHQIVLLIKKYLIRRLISFLMLFVFIFLTIGVLISSSFLSFILAQRENYLLSFIIGNVVNAMIFTVLFASIYGILPDRRVGAKNALLSGALTAVFFTVGKLGINLYLTKAGVGSVYGAVGTIVVLLAWIYFSSFIMFVGAELSFLLVVNDKRKHIIETTHQKHLQLVS